MSGLRSDIWIRDMVASYDMITPYTPTLVREDEEGKVISYGQSSYGYDLRLSDTEFKVFKGGLYTEVDPKDFDPYVLTSVPLTYSDRGKYFLLPGHSYGLGVIHEHLNIPRDTTVLFIGKSTYARAGVIANVTPGEAGWRGHLTIEISNSSPSPVRVYAMEGILQALFFKGDICHTSYDDRGGKYQD